MRKQLCSNNSNSNTNNNVLLLYEGFKPQAGLEECQQTYPHLVDDACSLAIITGRLSD